MCVFLHYRCDGLAWCTQHFSTVCWERIQTPLATLSWIRPQSHRLRDQSVTPLLLLMIWKKCGRVAGWVKSIAKILGAASGILSLLVDAPMISISKSNAALVLTYRIHKIFRKPGLWPQPWDRGHWDLNSPGIFSRYTCGINLKFLCLFILELLYSQTLPDAINKESGILHHANRYYFFFITFFQLCTCPLGWGGCAWILFCTSKADAITSLHAATGIARIGST